MSQTQKVEERTVYSRWSTSDCYQHQADHLREEDPDLSEEDALDQAHNDDYIIQEGWEFLLEDLQTKLDEYNPDERGWFVIGINLGWQNRSGEMSLEHLDSKALLGKILPDTECVLNIFVDDDSKTIEIQCFHHDSPVGNEWYYISVAEEEQDDGEG